MAYKINHIHVKAVDPEAAVNWFIKALNFRILSDQVREVGDRFIRCETEDGGLRVNFSNARTGDTLQDGLAGLHYGLEHFGVDSADIEKDIEKLVALGAVLAEGPTPGRGGQSIAFLDTPHGVRVELIQAARQ